MSDIEIKIPISMPSLNKLLKWHWSKKTKKRKFYQLLIRNEMNRVGYKKVKKNEFCSLEITTSVQRKYDYDNLVGGMKPLLDALRKEGFIYDDNPDSILVNYHQKTDKKPYTTIKRLF